MRTCFDQIRLVGPQGLRANFAMVGFLIFSFCLPASRCAHAAAKHNYRPCLTVATRSEKQAIDRNRLTNALSSTVFSADVGVGAAANPAASRTRQDQYFLFVTTSSGDHP